MVTDCFVQFMQSVCELAILPFAHGCQSRVRAGRTRKGSALPWTVFRVTHPTLPGDVCAARGAGSKCRIDGAAVGQAECEADVKKVQMRLVREELAQFGL